jgi:hypothetical protein
LKVLGSHTGDVQALFADVDSEISRICCRESVKVATFVFIITNDTTGDAGAFVALKLLELQPVS